MKRRWYFRKYRSLKVKQRVHTSTPITTQDTKHIDLKNTNKENEEDLEISNAEDHFLPSGELKVCGMETSQAIKQTQQVDSTEAESHNIQTASEMKPKSSLTEESKPSIKEDSPVQGQSPHTVVLQDEHHNKTELKMKKDQNCQISEQGDMLETECDVIRDLSPETEMTGSGDRSSDIQMNNVQQTSTDKRLCPNYFVAIRVANDEVCISS